MGSCPPCRIAEARIGVSMMPGAMVLILMPSTPCASATSTISPHIPAFDAAYAVLPRPPCPRIAAMDMMLTIDPPPAAAMCGITALVRKKGAVRFTARTSA